MNSQAQWIGQQLRERREARGISLEQVSRATMMRVRYLQALEAGDLQAMPSQAQARGFQRAYADYLGLDIERLGNLASEPQVGQAPAPQAAGEQPARPAKKPGKAKAQRDTPAPEALPAEARQDAAQAAAPEVEQPDAARQADSAPGEPGQAAAAAPNSIGAAAQPGAPAAEPAKRGRSRSKYSERAGAPGSPASAPHPAGPPPGATENLTADLIFAEIGRRLQHQRELLGLSLDDIERNTRLRRHYLAALEAGRLENLPSPVQGRGMLNNYAVFLGMDPEPLLLRFAEGLQTRLAARQVARPEIRPTPQREAAAPPALGPLRRLFSSEALISGAIMVLIAGFVLWGAIRIYALVNQDRAQATQASLAQAVNGTLTPTVTLAVTETLTALPPVELPAEQPTFPAFPSGTPGAILGRVQVYLTVHQRAWLRVTVDGEVEFDGRVSPGSAYTFAGEEQVELLTGNGAALQVFFNEEDLGLLGATGEIVNQVFTPQGLLTPTPTITPTPTATSPVTPTPTITPTLEPGSIPPPATVPALP